jgi:hypothetical protein
MNDDPLTREEIRQWRRNNFWRGLVMLLCAIPLGIGLGIIIKWIETTGALFGARADVMHNIVGPVALVLTIMGFMWLLFRKQNRHEILHERLLRQKMDRYQNLWRLGEFGFLMILFGFAYVLTTKIGDIVEAPARDSLPFLYVAAIATSAIATWKGPAYLRPAIRKGLNDELTKDLRRKSVVVGYLCLVVLLSIAFGVILFRPELAPIIILWLMFAGVAIPIAGYTFLEWRASRGG